MRWVEDFLMRSKIALDIKENRKELTLALIENSNHIYNDMYPNNYFYSGQIRKLDGFQRTH